MSFTIQNRYSTPARVLIPKTEKINGVVTKTYDEGSVFFCSAKSYGGTETIINNVFVIQDTLEIECFYREDIKGDCKLRLLDDNTDWEILTTPEIIERQKKTLKFKVRKINTKV